MNDKEEAQLFDIGRAAIANVTPTLSRTQTVAMGLLGFQVKLERKISRILLIAAIVFYANIVLLYHTWPIISSIIAALIVAGAGALILRAKWAAEKSDRTFIVALGRYLAMERLIKAIYDEEP